MAHIFATLTGVPLQVIKDQLTHDKEEHAKDGMFLEHLWMNAANAGLVHFLFRVDDLEHCREQIVKKHAEALKHNADAKLPVMIYLGD
jgi:hypothetical protein